MKTLRLSTVVGIAAVVGNSIGAASAQTVEQLVVIGDRIYPASEIIAPAKHQAIDTAELLTQIPGANVNSNGALTGIAQYRGLYGDRVAVSIDGLGVLSGGPNAMDTPLSYASPLLLDGLSVERGIASVANSLESLGGHFNAIYDRGNHATNNDFNFSGSVQARTESVGNLQGLATRLVAANNHHKFALLSANDQADDFEFPDGKLFPTRLDRQHNDLSYSYRNDNHQVTLFASELNTSDTGTPALPMDIAYIDTEMSGIRLNSKLAKTALEFAINRSDVDHVMTNYALRTPPTTPMGFRANHAIADGTHWRFGSHTTFGSGELRMGVGGESATHTSTITNPNVAPFAISNFNHAQRDIVGIYGQWNQLLGEIEIEAGIRANRIELNSDPVGASIPPMNPMMVMMGINAGLLADTFNGGSRGKDHDNVDLVLKLGRILNPSRSIYIEIARKTRAPSYQEAFLWLPLQSTGGLADGRSYIGNPNLASEVSNEINFGTDWRAEKAWFGPQLFYKDIDDYIQGTPSSNMTANMLATMMTGSPALEFTNTQAKVFGIDLAWGYAMTKSLSIEGVLTFTRGKRTDIKDNLYRLAPLNGVVSLVLNKPDWSGRLELVAYDSQDDVAAFNNENATPGYGIMNARLQWRVSNHIQLIANIENVLDRKYAAHLSGINRVNNADIAVGSPLFGIERNLNIGATFQW